MGASILLQLQFFLDVGTYLPMWDHMDNIYFYVWKPTTFQRSFQTFTIMNCFY